MTDKEQEFDQLIRTAIKRPTQGCKCLEAMLAGYRSRHYRDDGGMYNLTEQQSNENKEK